MESADKRRCEGKILNKRICYSSANKTVMVVRTLPISHKPHFKMKDCQPSVFCLNEEELYGEKENNEVKLEVKNGK